MHNQGGYAKPNYGENQQHRGRGSNQRGRGNPNRGRGNHGQHQNNRITEQDNQQKSQQNQRGYKNKPVLQSFAVTSVDSKTGQMNLINLSNNHMLPILEQEEDREIKNNTIVKFEQTPSNQQQQYKKAQNLVRISEVFGPLGNAEAEFKVIEQGFFHCRTPFKQYEDQQDLQALLNNSVFMGKFQVNENNGQYSIKSGIGKKIVPKGKFNRALDGCEVVFRPLDDQNQYQRGGRGRGRGGNSKAQSVKDIKVVEVIAVKDFDQTKRLHGVLSIQGNMILFQPMNRKVPQFQVISVNEALEKKLNFELNNPEEQQDQTEPRKIKKDPSTNSNEFPFFSALCPFETKFMQKCYDNKQTFFKLEYSDWIENSEFPFGQLLERYGQVSNINDCIKMIAAENNIDPDGQDFGKGVLKAVKSIEDQYLKLVQTNFLPKEEPQPEKKGKKGKKAKKTQQPEQSLWNIWDKESLVFSIDNKGASALDDCLSIDEVLDAQGEKVYKVSVHISFVDYWVKEDSAIDNDAKQRVESIYLGKSKDFFRPMLPNKLYRDIGSLKKGEPKLATSVSFILNEDGLVDFNTVEYSHSVIRNEHALSYQGAQKLLEEDSSKIPEDKQLLQQKLNSLLDLTSKIRSRRAEQCNMDQLEANSEKAFKEAVEEVMWLTKLVLPGYRDKILSSSDNTLAVQKVRLEELRLKLFEEQRLAKIKKAEEKEKRKEENRLKQEEAKKRKAEKKLKRLEERKAKKEKKAIKLKELREKVRAKKEKSPEGIQQDDQELQELEAELLKEETAVEEDEDVESSTQSEFTKQDDEVSQIDTDISDIDLGELSESSEDEQELENDLFKLDENAANERTSIGAENYLTGLFKDINCEIDFTSWFMLQKSFRNAQKKYEGMVMEQYLKTSYATNFQYMHFMIKRNAPKVEKTKKIKPSQDSKEDQTKQNEQQSKSKFAKKGKNKQSNMPQDNPEEETINPQSVDANQEIEEQKVEKKSRRQRQRKQAKDAQIDQVSQKSDVVSETFSQNIKIENEQIQPTENKQEAKVIEPVVPKQVKQEKKPQEKTHLQEMNEVCQKNNNILFQIMQRLLLDLTGKQIQFGILSADLKQLGIKVSVDQALCNLYVKETFEQSFAQIVDQVQGDNIPLAQKYRIVANLVTEIETSILLLKDSKPDTEDKIPLITKPAFLPKKAPAADAKVNIAQIKELIENKQVSVKKGKKDYQISLGQNIWPKFFDPHFHIINKEGPHDNGILDPPNGGTVYSIQDFEQSMQGVTLLGGVVVEVISDHIQDEAKWFDQQLDQSKLYYGLVAGIDLTKDIEQLIDFYKTLPHFRGVRHIFNFEPNWPKVDRNLLEDPKVIQNLKLLADNKISFDLQLNPHQFKLAAEVLSGIPNLTVIIDHCGSPTMDDIESIAYMEGIKLLAQCPNVFMKISFIGYTDTKWNQNKSLMDKIREVIQIFTPQRCMFASNFPVDSLEKYGSWNINTLVDAFNKLIKNFSKEEQECLWFKTGMKAYQVSDKPEFKDQVKEDQKKDEVIDSQSEQIVTQKPQVYSFSQETFDKKLTEFMCTSQSYDIKFHNPLRDYRHLLAGRLVTQLIHIQKQCSQKQDPTKTSVQALRTSIEKAKKQHKKLITFQEQAQNVAECNQKLKRAEREIEKMRIAHKMQDQVNTFKVLQLRQNQVWEPTLQEFSLVGNQYARAPYEEYEVDVSVKSVVPLTFQGNQEEY